MYSLETLIVLVLLTLVIGFIAGTVITQRLAPSKQSQKEMEQHLGDLQQQQKSYQREVAEHFAQTGQLLNQLTESYRDVHNHLAQGAKLLADQTVGDAITALPEGENAKPLPIEEQDITQPLDYAPKSTPYEKGMLNEKFGLDDVKSTTVEDTPLSTTGTNNNN